MNIPMNHFCIDIAFFQNNLKQQLLINEKYIFCMGSFTFCVSFFEAILFHILGYPANHQNSYIPQDLK